MLAIKPPSFFQNPCFQSVNASILGTWKFLAYVYDFSAAKLAGYLVFLLTGYQAGRIPDMKKAGLSGRIPILTTTGILCTVCCV